MRGALFALLLLFPLFAYAEEISVTFHERATLTIETHTGEITLTAVGSREVFSGEVDFTPNIGRLVGSGLLTEVYEPPLIAELKPGHFLVCENCTAIAMRTFGISEGADFDSVRALADAAPRDVARRAHREFRPSFLIIVAPPDFDLVEYPARSDLARYFGSGVRLKSLSVEITNAPVTDSIVLEKMPWICDQIDKLNARRTDGNSEGEIAIRRSQNALEDLAQGVCA